MKVRVSVPDPEPPDGWRIIDARLTAAENSRHAAGNQQRENPSASEHESLLLLYSKSIERDRGNSETARQRKRLRLQVIRPADRNPSGCQSIPHDAIFLHDRQSPVIQADPGRIDVSSPSSFLNWRLGCAAFAWKR